MPTRAEISQLVDDYLAGVSAGDVEAIVKLFAPDARQEDPVGSPVNVGTDAIRAFFEASTQVELTATRFGPVCVMGNEAIVQIVISMPAGEEEFRIFFTDKFTVDDDNRIVELLGWNDAEADLTDAPGARLVLER